MAECPLRGREGRQGLKPAASFLCIFDAFFLAYKLDGRFIDIPCRSSFFIYLLVPKCLSHPRLLYFLPLAWLLERRSAWARSGVSVPHRVTPMAFVSLSLSPVSLSLSLPLCIPMSVLAHRVLRL